MKFVIKLIFLANFIIGIEVIAQENNDFSKIIIAPYMNELTDLSEPVKKNIENKLVRIVSANGMSSTDEASRFIIVPKIVISEKYITPSAPPMIGMNLDITLQIGDGIEGVLYNTFTISTKGVGTNDTQAYLNALKTLQPGSKQIKSFLEVSKSKVVQYYNSKCNDINTKAKNSAQLGNFDEAIHSLLEVPSIASECYNKSLDLAITFTKSKLESQCQTAISRSKNLIQLQKWSEAITSLNGYNAGLSCYNDIKSLYNTIAEEKCNAELSQAKSYYSNREFQSSARILASIPANSVCSEKSDNLLDIIKSELDEESKKEWDLAYEKYDRDQTLKEEGASLYRELARREMSFKENQGVEIKKLEIEAARAIGVAYGKNQPRNVTYNISGW